MTSTASHFEHAYGLFTVLIHPRHRTHFTTSQQVLLDEAFHEFAGTQRVDGLFPLIDVAHHDPAVLLRELRTHLTHLIADFPDPASVHRFTRAADILDLLASTERAASAPRPNA